MVYCFLLIRSSEPLRSASRLIGFIVDFCLLRILTVDRFALPSGSHQLLRPSSIAPESFASNSWGGISLLSITVSPLRLIAMELQLLCLAEGLSEESSESATSAPCRICFLSFEQGQS
jgi:hypothetical protein